MKSSILFCDEIINECYNFVLCVVGLKWYGNVLFCDEIINVVGFWWNDVAWLNYWLGWNVMLACFASWAGLKWQPGLKERPSLWPAYEISPTLLMLTSSATSSAKKIKIKNNSHVSWHVNSHVIRHVSIHVTWLYNLWQFLWRLFSSQILGSGLESMGSILIYDDYGTSWMVVVCDGFIKMSLGLIGDA